MGEPDTRRVRRFKQRVLTVLSDHDLGHKPLPLGVIEELEAESERLFGASDAVVDIRKLGAVDAEWTPNGTAA